MPANRARRLYPGSRRRTPPSKNIADALLRCVGFVHCFHLFIFEEFTMPNWASHRLTLSGPHAEIMRFRNTCIGVAPEEDSDKECFDLGALVPMPPVIVATLKGRSAEAKQAAVDATGFESWHDWCIAHWG